MRVASGEMSSAVIIGCKVAEGGVLTLAEDNCLHKWKMRRPRLMARHMVSYLILQMKLRLETRTLAITVRTTRTARHSSLHPTDSGPSSTLNSPSSPPYAPSLHPSLAAYSCKAQHHHYNATFPCIDGRPSNMQIVPPVTVTAPRDG